VSDYPAPTSWTRGDVKEYETIVKIDNPPPGLKPGLTAEVKIRVHELDKALQVPVQAILEQDMHFYSVLKEGKIWKPREVQVGWSNDKFVMICDVVKFPVPVLFDFNDRPFCLVQDGKRWHSRRVEVVSRSGDDATIKGAPGEITRAKAVFDHDGGKVQLVFSGQLWALRPMKRDSDSGQLVADPDAVAIPIQAAFQSADKLYCLDTDYQVWAKLIEAEPSHDKPTRKPGPRGPRMTAGDGEKPARPAAGAGPKGDPPKTPAPEGEKPPTEQTADKPAPTAKTPDLDVAKKEAPGAAKPAMPERPQLPVESQVWTSREVNIGPAPDDPDTIGIGLEPGEKVVLNAVAFRSQVKLPKSSDGRSKLNGNSAAEPKADARPPRTGGEGRPKGPSAGKSAEREANGAGAGRGKRRERPSGEGR
jgi:hypothetical protein